MMAKGEGERTSGAAAQQTVEEQTVEEQLLWLFGGVDDFEAGPEQKHARMDGLAASSDVEIAIDVGSVSSSDKDLIIETLRMGESLSQEAETPSLELDEPTKTLLKQFAKLVSVAESSFDAAFDAVAADIRLVIDGYQKTNSAAGSPQPFQVRFTGAVQSAGTSTGFAYIRNQIFYTLKFLCEEALRTPGASFAKLAENEGFLQNILMLKSLILVLKGANAQEMFPTINKIKEAAQFSEKISDASKTLIEEIRQLTRDLEKMEVDKPVQAISVLNDCDLIKMDHNKIIFYDQVTDLSGKLIHSMNGVISRRASVAVKEGKSKNIFQKAFGAGCDSKSELLTNIEESIEKSIDQFKSVLGSGESAMALPVNAEMISASRIQHLQSHNAHLLETLANVKKQVHTLQAEVANGKGQIASFVHSTAELREEVQRQSAEATKAKGLAKRAISGLQDMSVNFKATKRQLEEKTRELDSVNQVLADARATIEKSKKSTDPEGLSSFSAQLDELLSVGDENSEPSQQGQCSSGGQPSSQQLQHTL